MKSTEKSEEVEYEDEPDAHLVKVILHGLTEGQVTGSASARSRLISNGLRPALYRHQTSEKMKQIKMNNKKINKLRCVLCTSRLACTRASTGRRHVAVSVLLLDISSLDFLNYLIL